MTAVPNESVTMDISDFDFTLPEKLIAQHPPEVRGSSRLLVALPVICPIMSVRATFWYSITQR